MTTRFPNSSRNRPNSYYVWRRAEIAFGDQIVEKARQGKPVAIKRLTDLAVAGKWHRLVQLLDEIAGLSTHTKRKGKL